VSMTGSRGSKSSGSGIQGRALLRHNEGRRVDLLRAARVRRARAKALATKNSRFGVIYRAFTVLKERVQAIVTNFGLIFPNQPPVASADLKLAT